MWNYQPALVNFPVVIVFAVKRLTNRPSRILMVLFTIMALLFVQTFHPHIHSHFGHHDKKFDLATLVQHEHHADIALLPANVKDLNHGPVTEVDLAADAVVKTPKFDNSQAVLLSLFFVLLGLCLISTHRWSTSTLPPFISRALLFRPPLRAPPL